MSNDQIQMMRVHVEACYPLEGCGMLGGVQDCVDRVIPVTNMLHSSTQFRMDPREQIDAFFEIEESGGKLLGIFHSHPTGPDHPSDEDIRSNTFPEVIHIIWHPLDDEWNFKAYSIDLKGAFTRVGIDIIEP